MRQGGKMGSEEEIAEIATEAERQLRLYETVLANTPDFVYVFSLDHKVLYANDALIKMWGRGREGVIGKTFLEIGYEPWHAEMHCREIDQVRATGQPIRGEVPFTGTYGTRHYDYIFVPIFGADGEVEAVAGTTRDLTERKEAEERLRAGEERQSFIVKLADTLRPLSDPLEIQAEASRVLGEHLGASRVVYFEIRGDEYIVERDHSSDVKPLVGRFPIAAFGEELIESLLAGRTVVESDATSQPERSEAERASYAAIQVIGHVDVPLVKEGEFVAGMAVHSSTPRDWTATEIAIIEETAERTWAAVERVRVEVELRQSEDRAAFVRSSCGVGFWYCDLPFEVLHWDDLVKAHFHLPPDAVVTIDNFYERLHPEDREPTRRAIERSIEERTPYDVTYRTVDPDTGATAWIRAIGRTFYADDGTPVRFDGVTIDVTEQKRVEASLKEADRRKDEFIATLAHELRNPLAPIRNGLHLMQLVGTEGKIEQARAMMERQLSQLVRLVDDLLDLSRVTSGKLQLRRERVALADIVEAAVETNRAALDRAGHELTIDLPGDPVYLEGDATRLAQVVSNLLSNSAKYTPDRGRIRLRATRAEDEILLCIADNGIGIPPEMLGRVFEMFIQVDRALEKTTGGLGIGLSLVKGLVEMHGGTIEARSEGEGLGSEFILRLPAEPAKTESADSSTDDETTTPPVRRRILVADDNVDSAVTLGMLLEVHGNEVRIAHDGLQAVEAAEAFRPDVILLDIAMPKMSGHDACRKIREQPWAAGVTLVAMTGWGQDEDQRRTREAGFDLHLVKPVDPKFLVKWLATLGGEES